MAKKSTNNERARREAAARATGDDGLPTDPDARRAAVDAQFDEFRARLDALDACRGPAAGTEVKPR